jgi:hypothetical protein
MKRLYKASILLMVIALPAAALPFVFTAAPVTVAPAPAASNLCFTTGAVTYRVSLGTPAPDYRVKIGAFDPDSNPGSGPHLRIQPVDNVESADFALVDDLGGVDGNTCASGSLTKTVQVVGETGTADLTLSLSDEPADADLKLFVHSARFGHRDAAALFAAMRLHQAGQKLAQYR